MEQALAEVAARVPGFKPPTGQALTDQLKRVATYKSPGIYAVLPDFEKQAKELKERAAAAAAAAAAAGASRGNSSDPEPPSRSSSPEVPQTTAIAQQPPQQKKGKSQQGTGKAAARSQQPTPEPQRKPQPGGPVHRSAVGGTVQQSAAKPLLQLVEDDLGIPSMQKPQPSPAQRTAHAGKLTSSPPAAKPKPLGTAAAAGGQQLQHRQTQGPGSKGLAGPQQQKKASAGKNVVATQRPMPAAEAGKLPAATPKQQKRKSPSGAPGVHAAAAKQLPAPGPPKPAKRSRTVRVPSFIASFIMHD